MDSSKTSIKVVRLLPIHLHKGVAGNINCKSILMLLCSGQNNYCVWYILINIQLVCNFDDRLWGHNALMLADTYSSSYEME